MSATSNETFTFPLDIIVCNANLPHNCIGRNWQGIRFVVSVNVQGSEDYTREICSEVLAKTAEEYECWSVYGEGWSFVFSTNHLSL